MDDKTTIGALLKDAALVLPLAVLALLIVLLVRRGRSKVVAHRRESVAPVADEAPPTVTAPVRDFERDSIDIGKRIDAALTGGDKDGLAALYLELARCYAELGNENSRMSALRSAAAYGARHGPHASHAAARLELAEVAYLAGDLTTACEQWQLARTACLEGGHLELHATIEKRMRANGCPTDWVLTDF